METGKLLGLAVLGTVGYIAVSGSSGNNSKQIGGSGGGSRLMLLKGVGTAEAQSPLTKKDVPQAFPPVIIQESPLPSPPAPTKKTITTETIQTPKSTIDQVNKENPKPPISTSKKMTAVKQTIAYNPVQPFNKFTAGAISQKQTTVGKIISFMTAGLL